MPYREYGVSFLRVIEFFSSLPSRFKKTHPVKVLKCFGFVLLKIMKEMNTGHFKLLFLITFANIIIRKVRLHML